MYLVLESNIGWEIFKDYPIWKAWAGYVFPTEAEAQAKADELNAVPAGATTLEA